jgi:hypothetical protein
MKPNAALFTLCLVAGCGGPDRHAGSTAPPPPPVILGKMTAAQAEELASQLRPGMAEPDATVYLEQRGLKEYGNVGDSFAWADSFPLTNGFSLVLEIDAVQPSDWGHGLVRGANIQSNGIILRFITLTNAPIPSRLETH